MLHELAQDLLGQIDPRPFVALRTSHTTGDHESLLRNVAADLEPGREFAVADARVLLEELGDLVRDGRGRRLLDRLVGFLVLGVLLVVGVVLLLFGVFLVAFLFFVVLGLGLHRHVVDRLLALALASLLARLVDLLGSQLDHHTRVAGQGLGNLTRAGEHGLLAVLGHDERHALLGHLHHGRGVQVDAVLELRTATADAALVRLVVAGALHAGASGAGSTATSTQGHELAAGLGLRASAGHTSTLGRARLEALLELVDLVFADPATREQGTALLQRGLVVAFDQGFVDLTQNREVRVRVTSDRVGDRGLERLDHDVLHHVSFVERDGLAVLALHDQLAVERQLAIFGRLEHCLRDVHVALVELDLRMQLFGRLVDAPDHRGTRDEQAAQIRHRRLRVLGVAVQEVRDLRRPLLDVVHRRLGQPVRVHAVAGQHGLHRGGSRLLECGRNSHLRVFDGVDDRRLILRVDLAQQSGRARGTSHQRRAGLIDFLHGRSRRELAFASLLGRTGLDDMRVAFGHVTVSIDVDLVPRLSRAPLALAFAQAARVRDRLGRLEASQFLLDPLLRLDRLLGRVRELLRRDGDLVLAVRVELGQVRLHGIVEVPTDLRVEKRANGLGGLDRDVLGHDTRDRVPDGRDLLVRVGVGEARMLLRQDGVVVDEGPYFSVEAVTVVRRREDSHVDPDGIGAVTPCHCGGLKLSIDQPACSSFARVDCRAVTSLVGSAISSALILPVTFQP